MFAKVAGVGVVDRGGKGDGVESESVGTVDRFPDVVKGVKSRTSGKRTRILFLLV